MRKSKRQLGLSFIGLMALVCVPLVYLLLARVGSGPLVYVVFTAFVAYLVWRGQRVPPQQPIHGSPPAVPTAQAGPPAAVVAPASPRPVLRRLEHFVSAVANGKHNSAEVAKRHLLIEAQEILGKAEGMVCVRLLELFGSSLAIVGNTKNIATLQSRFGVGMSALADLNAEFPFMFQDVCQALAADMREIAGQRVAELADEKVKALCVKAMGAKTAPTREKNAAAAAAKAEEFIALGYMTPDQAAALRASVPAYLAPSFAAVAAASSPTVPQP